MVDTDLPSPSPSKLPPRLSFKPPMELASSSSSPHPIRWRKGELIGAGAFGRVYMGMNLDSGELLAVKQVLVAANNGAKERAQAHVRELEEEVKLLQNLSHPNIVRYLGTAREDDALNIFLEFVPGGSIASLLGKFGSFPESVVRMYTRQLLQGLQYLHKNGIMHRDIKGANILVDNKGCIKLADFGASKQVVELVTLSGAKSMKGTPYWMAPEVIRQTGHSLPADIWSVGCTVIEMATGKPPWSQQFQEVAALFHIGTTKSHPPIPEHLSHDAQDFLLKCLKKEPHLRPTATELLQHPFANPEAYPSTVLASTQGQTLHGMRASHVSESSKRRHLDVGSQLNALEESSARRSLAFLQNSPSRIHWDDVNDVKGSFDSDVNCSVRLDSNSFMTKSFKSGIDFPKCDDSGWEQSISNPVAALMSFNPICEPSYVDDGWDVGIGQEVMDNKMLQNSNTELYPMPTTSAHQENPGEVCEFSFQCGSADEDEEVTESKIKAFLDEKALELKRLQTPLYMEYHSIQNVAALAQQDEEPSSIRSATQQKGVGYENFISPAVSPATRRQLTAPSSSSPSKASTHSGPARSRDSEVSVSSGSPGAHNRSVNFHPHADSPRLNDWKGLLQEAQQPVPSPRNVSSSEQQRLWKEELQKELEMKREEKRMLSRLAGSTKSSPLSKSASPKDRAQRPSCASPIF
ncbi:hypothetical protein GOP47_0003268 [Adiantum capillus-veneris]|uniref:mitogen-activated protein kinase kinase kinase n=1 Tax=Adiantum capillus-veneris TaxID=13818 RepID=A0A9D4VCH8_ADICA|nr:hypothetical protein GOP47_0003268 [Adiantum capillus-veneris]